MLDKLEFERTPSMDDFIYDQETGRCVARISENGDVFGDDPDGAKIATVCAGNVYDLEGKLVGHLQGDYVGGGLKMPAAFKKLLNK
jgi:hypothetical protein